MPSPAKPERYKHHRVPADLVSHGVWMYYRFSPSYRDIQELLLECGIEVSHEAIRKWCGQFGQDNTNLSAYGLLSQPVRPRCHLLRASEYRRERA